MDQGQKINFIIFYTIKIVRKSLLLHVITAINNVGPTSLSYVAMSGMDVQKMCSLLDDSIFKRFKSPAIQLQVDLGEKVKIRFNLFMSLLS